MNESSHPEQNNFPDFSDYGFLISKELGNNRAGGRVTYLAIDIKTQQKVVIKQFQFAQLNSNWSRFYNFRLTLKIAPHPIQNLKSKIGLHLTLR
ncbi:hypothetical protein ACF3DV_04455 [Chlorogloeopsis fritschii PCC 9212]|uniref:Uncharacterized protein n=1 Tax=Chlorogloeopsis fritschii PCC 6912 TaxID=211165 RepID=A0A433NA94_CHLFR|nr:hypothetical protein [Chlorogloeopsis fritschii]RUR78738.1 hypothetical protein PCC6912_35030 [Chlorogloeopsis fritschii PCC 6912]